MALEDISLVAVVAVAVVVDIGVVVVDVLQRVLVLVEVVFIQVG